MPVWLAPRGCSRSAAGPLLLNVRQLDNFFRLSGWPQVSGLKDGKTYGNARIVGMLDYWQMALAYEREFAHHKDT
jgi:hypothetical protein